MPEHASGTPGGRRSVTGGVRKAAAHAHLNPAAAYAARALSAAEWRRRGVTPLPRGEPRLHLRLRRLLKEPVNSLSHLLGVLLSLAGGTVLIAASVPDAWKTVSFIIYVLSAVLLFSASTLLHAVRAGARTEYAL